MWSWIFKVAVVSFLFIFLLHYLYSFFKTTLTSPKIKDLVNKPMRKYDSIYDSLENNKSYIEESESAHAHIRNALLSNSTSTQNPVKQNMKDELKKYLNELSGTSGNKGSDLNTNTNTNPNTNIKSSVNPMVNSAASPPIPDFAMSNMSSSSSFSSSYSTF